MNNYNILGHHLKRGIFNFCGKLSKGLKRPIQKFVTDMIYGILASKSSYLTEMARTLNEDIQPFNPKSLTSSLSFSRITSLPKPLSTFGKAECGARAGGFLSAANRTYGYDENPPPCHTKKILRFYVTILGSFDYITIYTIKQQALDTLKIYY